MIALTDLEGRWRLDRVITDALHQKMGHFRGHAEWHPDKAGLRQQETGTLQYGAAAPMLARQTYLWRRMGETIAVLFRDGQPFHRLSPDQWQDCHYCAADRYAVTYDFGEWPVWTQSWRVTGPHKNMLIISTFRRC